MGGGLMQLVAYGAQDIYLTGNPQITFFKVVYRRHTNFSCESIEQTFNGSPDFGKKVTVTVSRNGDLITNCYVQATLPAITAASGETCKWQQRAGEALIKSVEVEIGGQRVDKQYSDWLCIWQNLTQDKGVETVYNSMIGNVGDLTNASATAGTIAARTVYVPLQFWFNRNPGLALPLIALQYHEVKFNIEFETLANITTATTAVTGSLGDTSLYVDYVYLDTDERRRFAQTSHEYLIEQVQFTGDESVSGTNNKVKLNFNHPVKFLCWVVKNGAADNFDYTVSTKNCVQKAKLQLNGHDRFSERSGEYFNWVQPYQTFGASPATGINVYSFALKPAEHQPSGTANMSRIDNATLNLTLDSTLANAVAKVYAVNYNVLRIMSGMGGLAYSN
jgi:hypothetical protein